MSERSALVENISPKFVSNPIIFSFVMHQNIFVSLGRSEYFVDWRGSSGFVRGRY